MSYIDEREAWLDKQCHPDSTVARGLLKKGADWGREHESKQHVHTTRLINKIKDAWAEFVRDCCASSEGAE